jgi:GDSL-like lipase/acylhydrolase family protein
MAIKLREWAIVLVLSLVAIEVAFQAAVRLGFVHFGLPSYSAANAVPFWQVINKDFGVWRPPNARYRHRKTCFDVVYTTNSHGMRDPKRSLSSSQPRVAVLGDSMVEGWGIADGHRLTDRLTKLTGIEHLNFGSAGGFGTTQAWLLYKTLASTFDHRAVIFTILPDNDFIDDEPEPPETASRSHRPYLEGRYPDYTLRLPQRLGSRQRWEQTFNAFLDEFSLTYSARQHVIELVKSRWAALRRSIADPTPVAIKSYYYDYTPDQFDRLRYAVEQIKSIAGERPVLIVSVPLVRDYERVAREGKPPPLTSALRSLAANVGTSYVDLLELTKDADWPSHFLACDGHWSHEGHRVAAEILARHHPLRR